MVKTKYIENDTFVEGVYNPDTNYESSEWEEITDYVFAGVSECDSDKYLCKFPIDSDFDSANDVSAELVFYVTTNGAGGSVRV